MDIMDLELSSDCGCRVCDDCGLGTESEKCDNCGKDTISTNYCDESCYDYKLDWIDKLLEQFSSENNCEIIKIEGRKMGWEGRTAYTYIKPNHKFFLEKLTLSGDWTLLIESDGKSISIVRYSHDEPTGAFFNLVAELNIESEEISA
jgi:hypothetical protein